MPAPRDLASLPKAHLHLHLDGAMRRSTLMELAAAAGLVAVLPSGYGSFADAWLARPGPPA
jgi:adenosine deaminase